MTGAIFVDTNVFVYALDAASPDKRERAREWLRQLWRDQSGRTSVQVLNELYVTLTRKLRTSLSPDDAWDRIEPLLAWEPQAVDRGILVQARAIERRYRLSWWDSLIVSAAVLQDCDTLLSEDLQDGMAFGSLTVRNPFGLRANEVAATYASERELVRRHRPRGRPRKPGVRATA